MYRISLFGYLQELMMDRLHQPSTANATIALMQCLLLYKDKFLLNGGWKPNHGKYSYHELWRYEWNVYTWTQNNHKVGYLQNLDQRMWLSSSYKPLMGGFYTMFDVTFIDGYFKFSYGENVLFTDDGETLVHRGDVWWQCLQWRMEQLSPCPSAYPFYKIPYSDSTLIYDTSLYKNNLNFNSEKKKHNQAELHTQDLNLVKFYVNMQKMTLGNSTVRHTVVNLFNTEKVYITCRRMRKAAEDHETYVAAEISTQINYVVPTQPDERSFIAVNIPRSQEIALRCYQNPLYVMVYDRNGELTVRPHKNDQTIGGLPLVRLKLCVSINQ